jgi:carboxyl-terminal processing protease
LQFASGTYSEFIEAAESLIEKNPKGFIIDLRNNPGGYLNTSLVLVSLFTEEIKPAIIMEFADGSQSTISTNGNGMLKDYPVVILINEGSASASEIMAGAMQDFGLATIIGTQSFGKGSAQQVTNYTDGSLLKMTVSKWFTPNGNDIDGKGITPDIEIKNTENSDKQLNKALSHLSSL